MQELINVQFTGKEPYHLNTPHTSVNIRNVSGNVLSASAPNKRQKG